MSLSDLADLFQIIGTIMGSAISIWIAVWQVRRMERKQDLRTLERLLDEMQSDPDRYSLAAASLIRRELIASGMDGRSARTDRKWINRLRSRWHKIAHPALRAAALLAVAVFAVLSPLGTADGRSGDEIAESIQAFIAPVCAVLVASVGFKYIFGDTRSRAGFIGFVALGGFTYFLIAQGDVLLEPLSRIIKGWVVG